ncbi:hypothetical protein CGLO_00668 [Colletotrichum gloeosporioides Cg-14]|uniref:Uncharacterized protein n=1 Tax=Colletotrichum gloeosporioides (strain Cg-14) TaxID=1237896 RepID=T0MDG9_COLGC|nr:hypothetical protein CGLO_00668 [Colletotrichum gloeosporioides Cg-14]
MLTLLLRLIINFLNDKFNP